jgi:glucose/arabinose dehydrogenase
MIPTRPAHRRVPAALLAAVFPLACLPAARAQLTAVTQSPANVQVRLDTVATLSGFTPIDAATIPGNPNLFVATYVASSARVLAVDPVARSVAPTPFLNFAGTGVPISGQGLQGIAFSPDFNDSSKPGYRKFYTYEAETTPASPASSVMFLHPEVPNPATVGVLREWTANAAGTAINTAVPSRVVLNFGTPAGHMGGGLKFGPDGYLYLATGDGGGNGDGNSTTNSSDGFTGSTGTLSVPGISNGQDFTNPLGKVLRIDPYTTNADGSPRATPAGASARAFNGTTRYFIPGSNPFVGNPQNIYFRSNGATAAPVAPLPELFAFGFRNPWKLSFDKAATPGALPYVADVGSHEREEINLVAPGRNYGWPYREGEITAPAATNNGVRPDPLPFLKQTSPGVFAPYDLSPALTEPTQMSGPIARLGTRSGTGSPLLFTDRPDSDDHADGLYGDQYGDANAIVGGFVYRGSLLPSLAGMYVFGAYQYLVDDPTQPASSYRAISAGGRLLYFDPNESTALKTVREFNFDPGYGITNSPIGANNLGDLMGVVQADNGELYALFLNGDIRAILPSAVPEPASAVLLASALLLLPRRVGRRRAPSR